MKNIKPCPYCGGEVEVTRLADAGKEKVYRIQCKKCHALVAKGTKFEKETEEEGNERIEQYNKFMENLLSKRSGNNLIFKQTIEAKERDRKSKHCIQI